MKNRDFGEKLIEIRKLKGLTQGDVAEMCNVTIRTIQRIESGLVKPRASTIRIISKSLGFDFFEASDTGYGVNENQSSKSESHAFLWYLKDLFNLKTNAMKKITILSASSFLIIFLFLTVYNARAQSDKAAEQKSLTVLLNEDKTVRLVEVAFTQRLTLDSLVQIRQELQNIGITIHYRKIEFNVRNSLLNLSCEVICNDGFSGSFETGDLSRRNKHERIGFFRDYSPGSKMPFGTGLLDAE
jgi:transcriptional regulator with XRE-family HTH domain